MSSVKMAFFPTFLGKWHHCRFVNFIPGPHSCNCSPWDHIEMSTIATGDASPHHDAAPITVMICNTGVCRSLSWLPPDSRKSIIVVKGKSAVICEQNSTQLLSGPSDMLPSPVETNSSGSRGRWDTLGWPSDMDINTVKSATKCLSSSSNHV